MGPPRLGTCDVGTSRHIRCRPSVGSRSRGLEIPSIVQGNRSFPHSCRPATPPLQRRYGGLHGPSPTPIPPSLICRPLPPSRVGRFEGSAGPPRGRGGGGPTPP